MYSNTSDDEPIHGPRRRMHVAHLLEDPCGKDGEEEEA